jgi:hypothetical protein
VPNAHCRKYAISRSQVPFPDPEFSSQRSI